jgi:dTDP-4-amino-4,6-dideoxygalactose transaminase
MFVGLGGNFGELADIFELCQKQNLKLIVDAAHMAGSTSNGMHANKFGDITIYSFQAVKNLPTADSGILCTEDPVIDRLARKLSWLGIDKDTYQRAKGGSYKWDYDVTEIGHKYHGNSIVASIALAQLPHLEADNCTRRNIAAWYKQYLDSPHVKIIEHSNTDSSSYHLFQVRVPNRAKLMDHLSSQGISTGVHYKDNTLYPMYRSCVSHAYNARSFWETLLTLPCHLNVNETDVKRISCSINEFY